MSVQVREYVILVHREKKIDRTQTESRTHAKPSTVTHHTPRLHRCLALGKHPGSAFAAVEVLSCDLLAVRLGRTASAPETEAPLAAKCIGCAGLAVALGADLLLGDLRCSLAAGPSWPLAVPLLSHGGLCGVRGSRGAGAAAAGGGARRGVRRG